MNAALLPLSGADKLHLLRLDLSSFITVAFEILTPGTEYQHTWHIDLIAAKLTAFATGQIKRLVIMLPPRSLKSHCASICLPAWILGHDPTRRLVCASYSQELADSLARGCRTLMLSPLYRQLFPATQLSAARSSVSEFMTTRQGMRLATSVGGTLTGKGGDFLIIDDPIKADDVISDVLRHGANEWYESTAYPRLNDKANSGILIIMQRLHEDDLVGHVLGQAGWDVVCLPAIADMDEVHRFATVLGRQVVYRRAGEALHPERESLATLNEIKAAQGEYHFAGQYQQAPVPRGGGLFKAEWLRYYEPYEKPEKFDQILQSWDTANKEKERSDFSVCTTWGIKKHDMYLLDVLRARMDYPALKRALIGQIQRYGPQVVLIEDQASGVQLIQELRALGHSIIKAYKPEGTKYMRAMAQTGAFEGGFVRLPRQAAWLDAYVHELTIFPAGRFDDQVDSTAQALAWMAIHGVEPAIIQYYRDLATQQRGGAVTDSSWPAGDR